MESVIAELSHLLKPKVRAEMPESYYYLGKALVAKGKLPVADRALSAFIEARKGSSSADYRADAYYTLVLTRQTSGNSRGAIDACKAGLAVAANGEHDQLLYKLGELLVQDRRIPEARAQWGKLAKEGRDEQWRKLASQAITSLDLQQELSDVKSLVSK
jgi:tetratricopeptide (TPR) repeat protein